MVADMRHTTESISSRWGRCTGRCADGGFVVCDTVGFSPPHWAQQPDEKVDLSEAKVWLVSAVAAKQPWWFEENPQAEL